jgi:amino acid transporter
MVCFCLPSYCISTTLLTQHPRAFARDRGYPFPDTFSKVHPTLRIPVNAVLVTSAICIVINIIPVGSTVAFYAL